MNKITKQIRIQIDYTLTIDESVIDADTSVDDPQYHQIQKHLLAAVLSNRVVEREYIRSNLASALSMISERQWNLFLLGKSDVEFEEILQPAIDTLSETDREWIDEGRAIDAFYESTEAFHDCFEGNVQAVEIVSVDESVGES